MKCDCGKKENPAYENVFNLLSLLSINAYQRIKVPWFWSNHCKKNLNDPGTKQQSVELKEMVQIIQNWIKSPKKIYQQLITNKSLSLN